MSVSNYLDSVAKPFQGLRHGFQTILGLHFIGWVRKISCPRKNGYLVRKYGYCSS